MKSSYIDELVKERIEQENLLRKLKENEFNKKYEFIKDNLHNFTDFIVISGGEFGIFANDSTIKAVGFVEGKLFFVRELERTRLLATITKDEICYNNKRINKPIDYHNFPCEEIIYMVRKNDDEYAEYFMESTAMGSFNITDYKHIDVIDYFYQICEKYLC